MTTKLRFIELKTCADDQNQQQEHGKEELARHLCVLQCQIVLICALQLLCHIVRTCDSNMRWDTNPPLVIDAIFLERFLNPFPGHVRMLLSHFHPLKHFQVKSKQTQAQIDKIREKIKENLCYLPIRLACLEESLQRKIPTFSMLHTIKVETQVPCRRFMDKIIDLQALEYQLIQSMSKCVTETVAAGFDPRIPTSICEAVLLLLPLWRLITVAATRQGFHWVHPSNRANTKINKKDIDTFV